MSFEYGDGKAALHGVSLDAPAGQTTALVGPSGAGKTTILNLIPRFFDGTSGSVWVDGQDVRSVTLGSLRDAIGLVTQDVVLFDDTVRANIRFGNPTASEADVEAAADAAGASSFITALPMGFDTGVGERGESLSGGQRQRIAIARAVLKDAPILLLDEATSALDSETEHQIQGAMDALRKDRTTVVIAHRLATVQHADLIHVIVDGKVVESGAHGALMAQGGTYARLYTLQFAAAETRQSVAAN